jgi:hypothetical protein
MQEHYNGGIGSSILDHYNGFLEPRTQTILMSIYGPQSYATVMARQRDRFQNFLMDIWKPCSSIIMLAR